MTFAFYVNFPEKSAKFPYLIKKSPKYITIKFKGICTAALPSSLVVNSGLAAAGEVLDAPAPRQETENIHDKRDHTDEKPRLSANVGGLLSTIKTSQKEEALPMCEGLFKEYHLLY